VVRASGCDRTAGAIFINSSIISYWLSKVNSFCFIIGINSRLRSAIVIPSKYLRELEDWLTPAEAGHVIGITKQGMIKRLEEGRQRGVRTRQGWLVDPEDLKRT
jgi:hypothetical protein